MEQRIGIVGGGAAGFFAALACAEANKDTEIVIFEKTSQFLSKVKISGGGRCNVTHACFNEREFTARYPRGERELLGPFKQFSASDTVAWFAQRGVELKTESDGRMFPTTDTSQTIIDCLLGRARGAGVKLISNCGVQRVVRTAGTTFSLSSLKGEEGRGEEATTISEIKIPSPRPSRRSGGERDSNAAAECGGFELSLSNGETLACDKLLLAIGGCRTPAMGQLAVSLGHTLELPVPSLFTFHIETPWLRELAGVSVENAEVSVAETKLSECGALLATHWGLSGPAVLRLSAWGARVLAEKNYQFALHVNWLPHLNAEKLAKEFQNRRQSCGAKLLVNVPIAPLTARLWEQLVLASGVSSEARWSAFSTGDQQKLIRQLLRSEFQVTGKSLNKDEFVTCGGVRLREVNFKTMESRICPNLFFAGEVLDVDGITGGFNFQAAWTTGWIAGRAMAGVGS